MDAAKKQSFASRFATLQTLRKQVKQEALLIGEKNLTMRSVPPDEDKGGKSNKASSSAGGAQINKSWKRIQPLSINDIGNTQERILAHQLQKALRCRAYDASVNLSDAIAICQNHHRLKAIERAARAKQTSKPQKARKPAWRFTSKQPWESKGNM